MNSTRNYYFSQTFQKKKKMLLLNFLKIPPFDDDLSFSNFSKKKVVFIPKL